MNIKKIIAGGAISAIMLGTYAVSVLAKVETVPGPWNVSGNWVFDYHYTNGANLHDMTLVQDENGALTGNGGAFTGNLPYQYPWTVESGQVNGDSFEMTAQYDLLPCAFTLLGTIAPDGSMSGTWTDNCFGDRNGTWTTTQGAATRFEGNHGQYVRSQENKQEAAQSRVGMPVQSNGHTK